MHKYLYKKLLIAALVCCAIAAASCGNSGAKKNAARADGKITVTASIFPPFDFVRAVAGDRVHLSMLLPPGAESHSFEPTPKDIITVQNSDVFVYIGGESEAWVNRILESVDTGAMAILALIDTVDAVEEEIVDGMEADADDEEGIAYDEHIWTSPENAKRMVMAIADALCQADSANAAWYWENAQNYITRLDELDAAFQAVVDGAQRRTLVFGDRFPFRYFADCYGLDYCAAFPGCSTETEPSAATVAFLINKIKAEKIPVVFQIEFSNGKMADTISEETGAKKRQLHSAHNVSKKDFEKGLTYLDIMQSNVQPLKEALQ